MLARAALSSSRHTLRSCTLRSCTRRLCSEAGKDPTAAVALGAGLSGGLAGGLVGLGGGLVMVPILQSIGRMSQHAAIGTSSAAVTGTGLAASLSFGSNGLVDWLAAAALASTAMLTARAGARYTAAFSPAQLGRALGVFQCAVAPIVPLKAHIVGQRKAEEEGGQDVPAAASGCGVAAEQERRSSLDRARLVELAQLAAVGSVAGFASGMFGIGGGVILTPALCALTPLPYVAVLGTTLASMVPPSIVSALTHWRMGNVNLAVVMPLVVGSGIGAFASGQVAIQMPEEPLQWLFAVVMVSTGGRKLWSLRGR